MSDNKNKKLIEDVLGIVISSIEKQDSYDGFTKVNDDDFAKINACFQKMPYLSKQLHDANYYSGTYKVIYEKGLGTLQKSAQNPNLYRGNIVAQGTNNEITGQALLQRMDPSEMMQLSEIALSAFTVASVVTNQYFLARIDDKLNSVEEKVNEIQKFLEIDRESQLWADGEFLREAMNNVSFILENPTYNQATITSIQLIRRTALANIKLYHEQLNDLKSLLNAKDNDKDAMKKLDKYKGYLPKYWYSAYLYEMAYYLEVRLSQITDKAFLNRVIEEMDYIINMFQDGYRVINDEINKYIDEVKALKASTVPAVAMKSVGKFLEVANVPVPVVGIWGMKGIGILLDKGGEMLEKHEKSSKQIKKQEVIDGLEQITKPYADLQPLKLHVAEVAYLNGIYNERLEIIMDEKGAYIASR